MTNAKKTVGIMGLSGDPVHSGHVAIAQAALTVPGLEEVWFMVTPHSPFKDPSKCAPLEHRTHLAHLAVLPTGMLGSKIKVSDFEVLLHRFGVVNSTAVMLEHFTETYHSLQPVWLMGADNLLGLHTWGDRWREIMERYPVIVFGRPGITASVDGSVAAMTYQHMRLPPAQFSCTPGTWTLIDTVNHTASSTAVRAALSEGRQPPDLTSDAYRYIRQYGLYESSLVQ